LEGLEVKSKKYLSYRYLLSAFTAVLLAISSIPNTKAQNINPVVSDIIGGIIGLAQQNIARHNKIRDLQIQLFTAGCYTGAIDGKLGPKTAAAIQKCNGGNGVRQGV